MPPHWIVHHEVRIFPKLRLPCHWASSDHGLYPEALSFEVTDRPRQRLRSGISQKRCCSSAQEFILGSSVGQRPLNSCPWPSTDYCKDSNQVRPALDLWRHQPKLSLYCALAPGQFLSLPRSQFENSFADSKCSLKVGSWIVKTVRFLHFRDYSMLLVLDHNPLLSYIYCSQKLQSNWRMQQFISCSGQK